MQSPTQFLTFVDLVCSQAQSRPRTNALVFLNDGETEQRSLTYGELDQRARAIAASLQEQAEVGDRAVLVYPYHAGLEFIEAFLGCLYAGVVAVPCHPPRNRQNVEDVLGRLVSSDAPLILTPQSMQAKLGRQFRTADASFSVASKRWMATDEISSQAANRWRSPDLHSDSLAFLQYTSGSTGLPKGVMVTHDALLYNQQLLKLAFGHTEQLVGVGWLPLFHDMGLIGNVLQSLYMGTVCILMSPLDFIQKPVRWLKAISTYGATTSGGPNFAYDLLCRYVTDEQRYQLDLSTWEVAFSGAEPVRPDTMQQFAEKFAPCGFQYEAFYPCYGMAEATLFITGGKKSKPPQIVHVDAAALEKNRVIEADPTFPATRPLVSCGHAWLDGQLAIVDPETCQRCAPHHIGEIWVSGSGVGKGYWNELDRTEQTFWAFIADTGAGPYLRTGDLGFVQAGELYITGRLRDVLVFWGLNHYPDHIERTVEACNSGFQPNSSAAFSIQVDRCDRLVIAQEVKPRHRHRLTAQDVVEDIRWAVFDQHFVDVYAIALVTPGGIPKTSSGKVQRRTCRDLYLAGELAILDEWRSLTPNSQDMPMLLRRYLNPATHLRRYWSLAKRWVRGYIA